MKTLADIRKLVASDLQQLNNTLTSALQSDIHDISTISQHITANPGKRLRPLLCLLCARACNTIDQDHVTLAGIIELIHTATLLHDDVVDQSTQRRGHITANARWGNQVSVLVGDFLYSRSFQLMAQLNRPHVFSVLADTTNVIAEGEVMQLAFSHHSDIDMATYERIIYHKTAKLFEAACQLGSTLGQADTTQQQAMQQFGQHFGYAYQMTDDILDYLGSPEKLGKNTGDDFNEGKVTLPLILGLAAAEPSLRHQFEQHLTQQTTMPFEQAVDALRKLGVFDLAKKQANQHLLQAKQYLQQLAPTPYRDALAQLTQLMQDRTH